MYNKVVISLYDYTGESVIPWAKAGYTCYCYDIQHQKNSATPEAFFSGGTIYKLHADLHDKETFRNLTEFHQDHDIKFISAFPVCTDLAVSGAKHFKKKEEKNPGFQERAAEYAIWCSEFAEQFNCPYYIENPISRLSTLWRKWDFKFHPYEYGGYLSSKEKDHPKWPEYIAPYDAYSKSTCLWVGGGFNMPEKRPVKPLELTYIKKDGKPTTGSQQFGKLGGKSMKTKNIRSATPRGFAKAVFEANK